MRWLGRSECPAKSKQILDRINMLGRIRGRPSGSFQTLKFGELFAKSPFYIVANCHCVFLSMVTRLCARDKIVVSHVELLQTRSAWLEAVEMNSLGRLAP
jgi:hypothetical protein